jgi:hypothetical protein
MGMSLEAKQEWCEHQDNGGSKDGKPLGRPGPDAQGADRRGEALRSNQANNPCTT